MNEYDYKNLTPFKWFILENFPFIEASFDALTNYQLFCKLGEEMNKIINNVNLSGEQVENLTNAFIQLQNYVNNYFSNLDVQDEIDNKLDEMAEQGILQTIILNYVNLKKIYNSFNDMINDEYLQENQIVEILGYYDAFDGGGATYKITTIDTNRIQYQINNTELYANLLIKDNTINIKQLGARPQDKNNNKYDIKDYLTSYVNYLNKSNEKIKLYIPAGVWYCSGFEIQRELGFYIFGDKSFMLKSALGTIITSLNNNQDHIFNIGNNTGYTTDFTISNIVFSSADFIYNSNTNSFEYNNIKNITGACLYITYSQFGFIDNLFFERMNGSALNLGNSWELYFNLLNFRDIFSPEKPIFHLATRDLTLQATTNITACTFDNIMFEKTFGDLIYCDFACRCTNCFFGTINFEDNKITDRGGLSYTTFNSNNIENFENSDNYHFSLFTFPQSGEIATTINNILLNNVAYYYSTYNGKNYAYDTLIKSTGELSSIRMAINNITIAGMNKDLRLLLSHYQSYRSSQLIINNIINTSEHNCYYDVDNFPYIRTYGKIKGINHTIYRNLTKSANPCYQFSNNRINNECKLISDSECLNDLGLAIKLTTNGEVGMCFILNSNKLRIRAKIPNEETAGLAISGDKYLAFDIVGTGSYKVYDIDLPNNFVNGDKLNLGFKGQNTASFCYLDYFIN